MEIPISWTVRRAVAGVAFVSPCCVRSELARIRFVYVPWVSEVTLTVIMQDELGAILPLSSLTDAPPPTPVREAEAPHPERDVSSGSARKTPGGRLSVSEAWVRVVSDELLRITTVNKLVPPAHMVLGLKLLVTEGPGIPLTLRLALAGVVLVIEMPPGPVEFNVSAGIRLIRVSATVEVTLIVTVHDPGVEPAWAGTVPPLREKLVPPGGAVTEPPQELVKSTGSAMVSPG